MEKSKEIAIIDVDDVCALLSDVWILERYNSDWDDDLTLEEIVTWDTHKYVKPECGLHIYDYLNLPELYRTVKPREGSVEGVLRLRELGYRCVFATSTPNTVAGVKFRWLQHWGYQPEKRDYIEIDDKSLLRGDIIVDDRYENVATFGGVGCLLTRPWNKSYAWPFRAKNWEDIVAFADWYLFLPETDKKGHRGDSNKSL